MSIFSVGVSALNTAQLGLSTTEHNISNVNTAGFHRQQIIQATNIPLATGSGFIGQGVHVDTIKRVYSQFLDNNVLQASTQSASLDTYLTQIQQVDSLLADPTTGLSPALQDFFSAVNGVANDPQSIPARQSMLSSASAMISRFQTLDQRLTEIRDGTNSQIQDNVANINSLAQSIANINAQIVTQGGSVDQPPNDLLDTRDNLLSQLNQLVRGTVVKQSDGSFNVFIGNGQPLVVGQQAYQLEAKPSAQDPQRFEVFYKTGNASVQIPSSSLNGGSLGGLLDFRNTSLDEAQNSLGRVAVALAQTFNDQHRLGQDLNGALGQDFFALPKPTVLAGTGNAPTSGLIAAVYSNDAASQLTTADYRINYDGTNFQVTNLATNTTQTMTQAQLETPDAIPGLTLTVPAAIAAGDAFTLQPTRFGASGIALSGTITTKTIAAAAPIVVTAAAANAGDAVVVDSALGALPLPALPITLTFSGGNISDGTTTVPYTPGTQMTIGNIKVTINGTPVNGDVFNVVANTGGVADNRNALLLAKLQTENTMVGGTTTYQGAYSQLVSQVGNKTAEVEVTSQAQANILAQAEANQQSLSGVNLDEEAANLLRYQEAYQAAGKMLQIATTLFDTILAIGA